MAADSEHNGSSTPAVAPPDTPTSAPSEVISTTTAPAPIPRAQPQFTGFPSLGQQVDTDAVPASAVVSQLAPPKEVVPAEQLDIPSIVSRDAPPWLVSAIFHMVALIVLGVWFLSDVQETRIQLDMTYAEDLGDQLDEENIRLGDDEMESIEQIITPDNLPPVDDPFAAPDMLDPSKMPFNITADTPSAVIGLALTGREKGSKESLLAAYGGNATTQTAVKEGLKWLARNQRRNGLWSLSGPYSDGVPGVRNEQAATAMALLAFQGNGHTHKGDSKDPYTRVVARAWAALLKRQEDNGAFYEPRELGRTQLYTQAQCTIALCELYAMTRDEKFLKPAQKAVDYCVRAQSPKGGWRYRPQERGDTSVTGWFVMALKSAQMAGLEVPSQTLDKIGDFLDGMSEQNGSRYKYLASSHMPSPSMTAEGLLCRQYLGWKQDDQRLVDGVEYLTQNRVDFDDMNVYYWYYATQACHHMEGKLWRKWNEVMRQEVPSHQVRDGRERGSWDPSDDRWALHGGGRLFTTCLSIYMLEVYYRHLPIYRQELVLRR